MAYQVAEKVVFAVFAVIPAKAGIQSFLAFLDSRLRGSDVRILLFNILLEARHRFSMFSAQCSVLNVN
jgi:hypothetical protein